MHCDLQTLLWVHMCPGVSTAIKRQIADSGVISYWPLNALKDLKRWVDNRQRHPFFNNIIYCAQQIESGLLKFLRYGHEAYPAILRSTPNPPAFLFAYGNVDALNTTPLIGVVGSRQHSAHAEAICRRWIPQFCRAGVGVVSGMALGVDALAHRAALLAGGYTVAVLGGGVDVCYPQQNRSLYQQILERGCVLSEMPIGYKPRNHDFPRRNRIVAGLSRAVLVVEAKVKSGSLITAKEAALASREVFAVPGSPLTASSLGCLTLINDGVTAAIHPQQILEDKLDGIPAEKLNQSSKYVTAIASGGMTTDELAQYFNLSIHALLPELTSLQLEGRIVNDGGLWFQRYD